MEGQEGNQNLWFKRIIFGEEMGGKSIFFCLLPLPHSGLLSAKMSDLKAILSCTSPLLLSHTELLKLKSSIKMLPVIFKTKMNTLLKNVFHVTFF